ncbi:MAG: hypothetical protein [Wendovervirus sonii]|uniref:Uncharacterized protein n=1 Tax=phage Lak_Megaphage_Sonny TaxID=3109229 RepID=A0ABZ0Z3X3_9CAUD|nr:MAG: hypothetical protein [phage Lak_Megaphage_Sonny]
MSKVTDEMDMAAYAASVENQQNPVNEIEMPQIVQEQPKHEVQPAPQPIIPNAAELHAQREEEIRRQIRSKGAGIAMIPAEQLPSKGLFYPEGTKIFIQEATIGDIKRWTSMNEDDYNDVTLKMQDIIESCCKINFGPNAPYMARAKDLIDIDRLYILFAIHDYTYPNGTNEVKIKLDEKTDTILKKDNVKFMEFPEKLMKYYNADKRCFSFPVKNTKAFKDTDGKMDIYLTTLGVAEWLTDYMNTCEQRQDNYDKDFLSYASILIPNWRYLTGVDKYYDFIETTHEWGSYEWTLISKIRDVLGDAASTPILKYKDNGGTEREVPLIFRDGFKSLFGDRLEIDL